MKAECMLCTSPAHPLVAIVPRPAKKQQPANSNHLENVGACWDRWIRRNAVTAAVSLAVTYQEQAKPFRMCISL
jgi:hypothetical protein